MDATSLPPRNPKEQLLHLLGQFEQAAAAISQELTPQAMREKMDTLREASSALQVHLARHPSPKELAEWRELPDSDAEIAAYGHELKTEHAKLQRELSELISKIDDYERALDRLEATRQIWLTCRALAVRIARHVASEQAELGRYSA